MHANDLLEWGRRSYEERRWRDAFEAFSQAANAKPLERDDLERLTWSAALVGQDEPFLDALERLHQACLDAQENLRAARAAFWSGFHLFSLGEPARATGWLARAQRLIAGEGDDCVERGYLLLPSIFRHLGAADNIAAHDVAQQAADIGQRCGDADLVALARNLQGRALLRQGRIEPGLALADEVMVAVTSDELSPLVTGIVYCNVIASCQQVYAVDRAREWTSALARWCAQQPQLVTFTGHCLVHRSEIFQLAGDWHKATQEIVQVCEGASRRADPDVFGDACYQQGELLRLRGDLAAAERAYRLASKHGRDPQPGLALLRVAQGQTQSAVSAMHRLLATTTVTWQRARFLPAFIEILVAAGEIKDARTACEELEGIAHQFGGEILIAIAAHARGALLLADGDASAAIEPLQHAFRVWKVGAPYIAARIRVLLGHAFEQLGDREGAQLEFEAARTTFEQLGAQLDRAALDATRNPSRPPSSRGLSPRELEVLRLLAKGKTNKVIARELCISERTVDRHVSNIFVKIDVGTRAAATAFAYQNGLI